MRRLLLLLIIHCSVVNWASAQLSAYQEYIEKYYRMAQDQMAQHKIPASITLAQGLLESAAGKSTLAVKANNHFGIKVGVGWTGPYVVKSDDSPNDRFRKYGSVKESYEDHSQFLLKPRYASLFDLKTTDYKGWAKGLKQCGYATSPTYAQQLINIIENYRLYQYDTQQVSSHHRHHRSERTMPTEKQTARERAQALFYETHPVRACNKNYYIVVQPGDNLPTLAMMTDVKKRKLRRYNELPKDYVPQPGDVLFLKKKRGHADKSMKGVPHIVEQGESMHDIAQHYGIRLKSLYKLNELTPDYAPQAGHMLKVY